MASRACPIGCASSSASISSIQSWSSATPPTFAAPRTLREASRELIEAFVNQLAKQAAEDREGLLCQLNRYAAKQPEVAS